MEWDVAAEQSIAPDDTPAAAAWAPVNEAPITPAETRSFILPLSKDASGKISLAVPGIIKGAVDAAVSGATLPGDVLKQATAPPPTVISDSDVNTLGTGRVLDLATMGASLSPAMRTGKAIAAAAEGMTPAELRAFSGPAVPGLRAAISDLPPSLGEKVAAAVAKEADAASSQFIKPMAPPIDTAIPRPSLAADLEARGARAVTSSHEFEVLRVNADQVRMGTIDALGGKASVLTQPITKEAFSRDVNGAVLDLLNEGKVKLAPDIKVSDQVRDLLQADILQPERFRSILQKHSVTPERFLEEVTQGDVGQSIRESAKLAGQTLQQLSELRKVDLRIRALAGEQSDDIAAFLRNQDNTAGNNAASFIQRVGNIWRGMLVSQISTAVRNAESQTMRAGIDVLERGFEQGWRTVFANPARQMLGKQPLSDPIDVFGTITTVLGPRRAAELTNAIADVSPTVRNSLFGRYSSDVNRATGGIGILGKIERGVDALNWANQAQEFFFRRAFFAESLTRRLRADGMNLDTIVAQNRIGSIPKAAIDGAIQDALEKTFARPMGNDAFGTFMSHINGVLTIGDRIPNVVLPFMRFMTEALRFQFEYSPLGATRLLHPAELKALASGEAKQVRVAAKALAGSSLLYGAYLLRNSEMAGPAWFEIKAGDKTIDTRPYNPFASYLFVADLITRQQKGTLLGMEAKDIAQGLVGVNFRAGAGLYIVDQLINDLAGLDSAKKIADTVKNFAGNVLAGFATPFQMLKDGIGQFVPSERAIKDTRDSPLTGPTLRRIPFADQGLPDVQLPTRAAPPERDQPLVRQLTGLTLRSGSNPAEQELGRLGFKRREIMAPSGDKTLDAQVAKNMGPLVESALSPLVQSPAYQAINSNSVKAELLRNALRPLREAALAKAKRDLPSAALREQYGNLPKRQRAVIEEQLRQRGIKLDLGP